MPAPSRRWWMPALCATASLAVLAVAAGSGATGPARSTPAKSASGHPARATLAGAGSTAANRYNVGATHSPQLLRQLAGLPAGHAGAIPPASRPGPLTGAPLTVSAARLSAIKGAVQGVDVASYQHPNGVAINWAQAATGGIGFAAVKATEGAYYQNPYALTDLKAAQAAGIRVAAYAFAIPDGNGASSSAVTQANYLVSYLSSNPATAHVPIMLDIEYDPYISSDHTNQCYGLGQAAMVSWIAAFIAQVQARTGHLPIIYGPPAWWAECTNSSTRFGAEPLWVPDWSSSGTPILPAGWANWSFWQYSSTGTVPGIQAPGNTDLDQLNLLDPAAQATEAGSAVDFQIAQAHPVSGQSPAFTATGVPAGLSISSTGRITGWAGFPGTVTVTVTDTALDSAGAASFSWQITGAADGGPAGTAGQIEASVAGWCLTDRGDGSASGTPADLAPCKNRPAQIWALAQNDTIRIHGKCLQVSGGGTSGAQVSLHSCTGSGHQQWLVQTSGQLVNPGSGLCLTDPANKIAKGTPVSAQPCTGQPGTGQPGTGQPGQDWLLPAGPVLAQIPGTCLDDSGNQGPGGITVDLRTCARGAPQNWIVQADGTVRLSGSCLSAFPSSTTSTTPVLLSPCGTVTGAEQWRLVPAGGGVTLVNAASGLCLADPGDATASGTALAAVSCVTGDPGMNWRVR